MCDFVGRLPEQISCVAQTTRASHVRSRNKELQLYLRELNKTAYAPRTNGATRDIEFLNIVAPMEKEYPASKSPHRENEAGYRAALVPGNWRSAERPACGLAEENGRTKRGTCSAPVDKHGAHQTVTSRYGGASRLQRVRLRRFSRFAGKKTGNGPLSRRLPVLRTALA